jgi:hypothetical protein
MKALLKLKIEKLPTRKRLGAYDFDGFPANAVLEEVSTGKLWLTDNPLCGNTFYNLREIHNSAVEVQSGAYVSYPARRWVHEHFDMVGSAVKLGRLA